jgi:hypothetical protein
MIHTCEQDDDDAEMDVDDEAPELMEDGSMEVDGEERSPPKRTKANSGGALARIPKTNRQLTGFQSKEVRDYAGSYRYRNKLILLEYSKSTRRRKCETSVNENATGSRRRERPIVPLRQKWWAMSFSIHAVC